MIKESVGVTSFLGVDASIAKVKEAIKLSVTQLEKLKSTNDSCYDNIITAHLLVLNDPVLMDEITAVIIDEKSNPITAVEVVFDKYIGLMKDATSEYLKQRYVDFLDVKRRVILNLNQQITSFKNLSECILIVDELLPSSLAEITPNVKGIIARRGGYTSHSAIICRNREIPYVIAEIPVNYRGNIVIANELVILNPSKKEIDEYKAQSLIEDKYPKDLKEVKVWANISNNDDIKYIEPEFSGIGLYRTEFLYQTLDFAMSVNKQIQTYTKALSQMNGRSITFRTFDFGDDKKCVFMPEARKGISTYYIYKKLFLIQIEALVKVAKKFPNQVRIMFPMIERVEEYNALKNEVLIMAKKYKVKTIPVGMMLETQQALINLNTFKDVDFISVGTNDLTWELFNLDRNQAVLYDSVYEDLLRIIRDVCEFSFKNNIDLCVCGELISQENFAHQAIKNGLKNVSISPNLIKHIYKAINEGE